MKLLKRYQNIPIEAKASLWYTVCNFFQKGISFIVIPVYVRLLTTGEYGEWTVFQSWRDILIILASLNLYAGIFTKALVDNTADRDRYTSSMQGLGTATTAFFIAVYAVFRGWLSRLIKIDPYIWPLLLLYFIVYPAFSFWSVRQRVENKYQSMVVVTAAVSVLTPIISLLLLYRTDLRARALMLGYLIVQCTVGLVFYVYLKDDIVGTTQVSNFFRRITEKAGIPVTGQHALRHTFATRCIEAGVPAVVLKKWLGHTNIHITLDTYADVFDRMHFEATDKFDDLMARMSLDESK